MPIASLKLPKRPPLKTLGIDLLLGIIAALGLAPFGIWGITPAALALLIWRLSHANRTAVFWHALAAGIGWFGLGMSWIIEPFLVEPEIYGWMAPFALILIALGGGLFWALPVWLTSRLCSVPRARSIAIPAALILSDWLRGWIFTGLPWALIGHVWIGTPIAQSAAWIGAIGLTAITVYVAALPAIFWNSSEQPVLRFLPGTGLSILLIGGIWAAGLTRLAAPMPADTNQTIRIVQPNAEQHLKWDPEWSTVYFQRLLDISSEPGKRDLVIWPETAVNFLLNDAAGVLPIMSQAAGATLITGIQRRDGERYYNSIAVVAPGGKVTSTYDKFHLVPFGEYIPWGDALAKIGISAFAAQSGNGYSSGPGPKVISLPGQGAFQPLICYEAIFPQHLRALDERPQWLLQVTNDGWFGQFSGPYQHLAQARLRSIETGLPMIRAANTGISAVIDARGGVRDSLPLDEFGKIDAPLPGALPPTLWMKWGAWPVIIFALLALGFAVVSERLKTRKFYRLKATDYCTGVN